MFSHVVDVRHIEQIFLTLQTAFRGRPGLRNVVTQVDQTFLKREKKNTHITERRMSLR